jgi:two-component system sensor histidine kinase TctE
VLTVRDEGPGISPELRQRLFAPFSAGSTSSGSGLGLAICREIVLALDGRIDLNNRTTQDNAAQVVGLDAVVHLPLSRHNS